MENLNFVIGLSIEEAKEKLSPLGFIKFRVVEKDGVPQMGTMDFRKDRVKFRMMNDLITYAYVG